MHFFISNLFFIVALLGLVELLPAEDFASFRGPNGWGVATDQEIPTVCA